MNVLIIGGLGYVGSTLNEVLTAGRITVDVIDLNIFSVNNLPDRLIMDDYLKTYKDTDLKKYDCVIWTMDIDSQRWFNVNYSYVQNYISKNLSAFKHTCENSNNLIFITEDTDTVNNYEIYKEFLAKKKLIAEESKTIIYYANEIYGTIERMRFDTVINGMVMSALICGNITVGNAVRLLPVAGHADFAEHVLKTLKRIDGKKDSVTHKVASYVLSESTYAVLIKQAIRKINNSDVEINFADTPVVFGEKDKELLSYEIINGGFATIEAFVKDIVRYAKSGDLVMKDNYNNDKIFNDSMIYNRVCNFFRSLE